jgi:hypothetical protein
MTTLDNTPVTTGDGTGIPARNMVKVKKGEEEPVSHIDPLQELLGMDTTDSGKVPQDEVDMRPRFTAKWVVRALDDDLNERLMEEASYYKRNPRTGQQVRELNTQEFARLVVYHCTVEPNLKSPDLFKKFGLKPHQHVALIKRILPLPGYVERISSRVMDLSGFSDQLIDVAKNSSAEED